MENSRQLGSIAEPVSIACLTRLGFFLTQLSCSQWWYLIIQWKGRNDHHNMMIIISSDTRLLVDINLPRGSPNMLFLRHPPRSRDLSQIVALSCWWSTDTASSGPLRSHENFDRRFTSDVPRLLTFADKSQNRRQGFCVFAVLWHFPQAFLDSSVDERAVYASVWSAIKGVVHRQDAKIRL